MAAIMEYTLDGMMAIENAVALSYGKWNAIDEGHVLSMSLEETMQNEMDATYEGFEHQHTPRAESTYQKMGGATRYFIPLDKKKTSLLVEITDDTKKVIELIYITVKSYINRPSTLANSRVHLQDAQQAKREKDQESNGSGDGEDSEDSDGEDRGRINSLQLEKDALITQLADREQRLTQANANHATLQSEKEELEESANGLRSQLADRERSLTQANANHAALQSEKEELEESVGHRLTQADNDNETLQLEKKRLEDTAKIMNGSLENAKCAKKADDQSLLDTHAKVESLLAIEERLLTAIADFEENNEGLQSDLDAATENNRHLRQERDSANADVVGLQNLYDNLENIHRRLQDESAKMKASNGNWKKHYEKCNAKVSENTEKQMMLYAKNNCLEIKLAKEKRRVFRLQLFGIMMVFLFAKYASHTKVIQHVHMLKQFSQRPVQTVEKVLGLNPTNDTSLNSNGTTSHIKPYVTRCEHPSCQPSSSELFNKTTSIKSSNFTTEPTSTLFSNAPNGAVEESNVSTAIAIIAQVFHDAYDTSTKSISLSPTTANGVNSPSLELGDVIDLDGPSTTKNDYSSSSVELSSENGTGTEITVSRFEADIVGTSTCQCWCSGSHGMCFLNECEPQDELDNVAIFEDFVAFVQEIEKWFEGIFAGSSGIEPQLIALGVISMATIFIVFYIIQNFIQPLNAPPQELVDSAYKKFAAPENIASESEQQVTDSMASKGGAHQRLTAVQNFNSESRQQVRPSTASSAALKKIPPPPPPLGPLPPLARAPTASEAIVQQRSAVSENIAPGPEQQLNASALANKKSSKPPLVPQPSAALKKIPPPPPPPLGKAPTALKARFQQKLAAPPRPTNNDYNQEASYRDLKKLDELL